MGLAAYRLALPPHLSQMPVRTIYEQVRKLRNKQIPMIKVQWQHQGVQDFSWETRALMEHQYPYLFTT
ncbi:unnamed protein product [Victoria cruziana]